MNGPKLIERHFTTPNGRPAVIFCREGTVDHIVAEAVFGDDEYGLRGRRFDGLALDIGAHIGTWAIAAALDNPGLRVIAIEPVPENADLISLNVTANGLDDRILVRPVAVADKVGESEVEYDFQGDEFVRHNRFIGRLWRDGQHHGRLQWVKTVDLASLATERIAIIKTDCEGGEWSFLGSPAVDLVDEIVGEYHDRPWPAIEDLLAATHSVVQLKDEGGAGLFRAVHH